MTMRNANTPTGQRKDCRTPRSELTQELFDEAKKAGWTVISMKSDWKRIFKFEQGIDADDVGGQYGLVVRPYFRYRVWRLMMSRLILDSIAALAGAFVGLQPDKALRRPQQHISRRLGFFFCTKCSGHREDIDAVRQ